MKKRIIYGFFAVITLAACSYPKNFGKDYYRFNEPALSSIKRNYENLYAKKAFTISFEENSDNNIGFEIITDTMKYVYHFNLTKPEFNDTLEKYKLDKVQINKLIHDMQQQRITWITNLDYYENYTKKNLVLMTLRNKELKNFNTEWYYSLAFFNNDQPFDEKGRFLDRGNRKRKRQIYGAELHRINNRVGYAITRHYR